MQINAKVDGIDKVMNKIRSYESSVQNESKKEIQRATIAIQSGATQRSPVDTGNLKNSNHYNIINGGWTGEAYNSANYAAHVEYGTWKTPAQPFLFPSFENVRGQFISNLERILRDVK